MAPLRRGATTHDRGLPPPEDEDGGDRVGAVVRWREIGSVVVALGETLAPTADLAGLDRLVLGLTEPLRRLDLLAEGVERALRGDDHALRWVEAEVTSLLRLQAGTRRRAFDDDHLVDGHDCSCDHDLASAAAHGDDTGRGGEHPLTEPAPGSILDDIGVTSLLLASASLLKAREHDATDAVMLLVGAAGALGCLALSLASEGGPGLVRRLESLAAAGLLAMPDPAPAPFRTLSAQGVAMPQGLPEMPRGVPSGPGDAPGLPRGPGRAPTPSEITDLLRERVNERVDELLRQIRGRRNWDPDHLDPRFPWWPEVPTEGIDVGWWEQVRCTREARRLLAVLIERPPHRPFRVTWATGIADVGLSGPCAGDTVTIRGSGFGVAQPPEVALLLPATSGCRSVDPASWADETITAVLPDNVVSGPVGFGDAGYIEAYDAWTRRINQASRLLAGLSCVTHVHHLAELFGECPPESTINRIRAGSPRIRAFTANNQTVCALEPHIPLVLRWTVQNAEAVTIERTSSNGPLLPGAHIKIVNPEGTSLNLGTPSYTNLQTWTYRLTLDGPCRSVSQDVTVVAGRRPQLRIESIEVTQGIQTETHEVALVQNKLTVVRVTVRHGLHSWGGGMVPGVRARVRARGPDIGTSPWFDAANGSGVPMAARPGASITVPQHPDRDRIDDTLNVLIPPAWAAGTGTRFDVEVRVQGFGAAGGFAGYREQVRGHTDPLSFTPRRALRLRYIQVAWDGDAPATYECVRTLEGAMPLLPTPMAVIDALGVGLQKVTVAPGENWRERRDELIWYWYDWHNPCISADGYSCPPNPVILVLIPGRFVRGKAAAIPSNVCFTPPAEGNWLQRGGQYAAHEIAHTLGQAHVRTDCEFPLQDPPGGGDPPSQWPLDGRVLDTPFDVVRHVTLRAATFQVGDLMTYCNNVWPQPKRWAALWTAVGP